MKDGTPNRNVFSIDLKSLCRRLYSTQGNIALALNMSGFHKFLFFFLRLDHSNNDLFCGNRNTRLPFCGGKQLFFLSLSVPRGEL